MLEVKDVSLSLDEKKILNNISFKVEKGKIYGLIGPNGVGKTTLIKCIVGIYKVDEGEILCEGDVVFNNPCIKEKIAYVSDENTFFLSFKVKDVIKYYKLAYEKFNETKFYKLNKIFKIPLNKRIYQLSKGMKMRVSIMIALSQEADYIILDEPTSGLDPILKNKLLQLLLEEVVDKNVAIIISSHHLNELERICDDVAIIKDGKIDYENTLEEMKSRIKKIQVAFDSPTYEEDLKIKGIYKISRVGRVFTIITEEYGEEFLAELNKFKPLFIEEIDLCLEDIFICRIEEGDNFESNV